MKIGEVSAVTGLAPSAIRFYEQSGLLPAAERGANGYRNYTEAAVARLRLIQMAQNLGFSLDSLRALFTASMEFPEDELLSRLDARLRDIDCVMSTLRAQRKALAALREQTVQAFEQAGCLGVADLVYSMVNDPQRQPPAKRGRRKA